MISHYINSPLLFAPGRKKKVLPYYATLENVTTLIYVQINKGEEVCL